MGSDVNLFGQTNAPRAPLRVALAGLALALALFATAASADPARAQCSIGDYLGTCTSAIGYAGCCPTANSIQWCEGELLCGIDCSGNTGAPDCCTASDFPGCSSAGVEACVCAVDDYCCDIFGAWDDVCVQIANVDCGACAAGGAPPIYCGWLDDEGFYDCRETPSGDPTGQAPMTCSGGCTPSCGGKQCGADGCGGTCGTCAAGSTCSGSQCVTSCAPSCAGKECGPDGCGGQCGQCTSVQACVAGQCEDDDPCVPSCGGRECGIDGCGGSCGSCAANETCNASGICQGPACVPQCAGKLCGDDGCGGSCGTCQPNETCTAGQCVAPCERSCNDKLCGDDGCGGSCGTCAAGESCEAGQCVSSCSCQGRACGDDGCGRICGYCIGGSTCNATTHQCEAGTPQPDIVEPHADVVAPQECPAGQVWSAYANTCVVDLNGPAAGRASDSGCASGPGGDASAALGLFGLALSLAAYVRRRLAARGLTAR